MKPRFNLIIDFDSTIVGLETLECLAEISLSEKKNKKQTISKIADYTSLAMNGQLSFEKSLEYRLKLMNITKNHIDELIKKLVKEIDVTLMDNIDFFKKNSSNIYIVSGGFQNIIESVMLSATKFKWNVFANNFIFDLNGSLVGVDMQNPLSSSLGKVKLIKSLNLNDDIIIVGDGYTDYEVKKYKVAKYFLAFIRYVKRDNVVCNADKICKDFNQVVNFLKKNYT